MLDNVFLSKIHTIIKKHNHELRFVGGCVRDHCIGRNKNDIDLASTALPNELIDICQNNSIRYVETGLKHGTITVLDLPNQYEITTLRIDTNPDGRHSDVVFTTSWEEDSKRRDFTWNAMSMDFNKKIYDYHNGLADLKHNIIRFVGDPSNRIREDFLRILRYFRFISTYSFTPLQEDLNIISSHIEGLRLISRERIREELFKILKTNNIKVLKTLNEIGLFSLWNISPQIDKMNSTLTWNILYMMGDDIDRLQNLFVVNNELVKKINWFLSSPRVDNPNWITLHLINGIPYEWMQEYLVHYGITYDPIELPIFPINGSILHQCGVPKDPEMKNIIRNLKLIWADSGFTLTKEELIKYIS